MAWRVMTPNQVSIWFSQLEPFGVKWKWTFGLASSQDRTSGVVWVDRLSSTTWISWPACGATAFFQEGQERGPITGGHAVADHLAGAHVQRREQVGRAMPHVVVGALLAAVELDRQQGRGPVEGLDLLGRGRDAMQPFGCRSSRPRPPNPACGSSPHRALHVLR